MKVSTRILRVVRPENGGPRQRVILDALAVHHGGSAADIDALIASGELAKYSDRRHARWGLPRAPRRAQAGACPPHGQRRAQAGFALAAQLIAGGVIAALAAGAFAYYNHVVSERARLELELSNAVKQNQEQAAVNADLRKDIKRRDALLAERERARRVADLERSALNAELEQLRNDPQVAAWMDGRMPGAIVERLRRRPAPDDGHEDGKAVPAGKPAGADRRAAPGG